MKAAMSYNFGIRQIQTNPTKYLNNLTKKVTIALNKNQEIDEKALTTEIHDMGKVFQDINNQLAFNKAFLNLAQLFVSKKQYSMAGSIYSLLIKLNYKNKELVELYATNALIIAKRQHDPVHIMARTHDLIEIYSKTQPNSEIYIKILYDQKRALSSICSNYESASSRYNSKTRKMKPIENYRYMLAEVKAELGLRLKESNPKLAKEELLGAQEILKDYERTGVTNKVERILSQL